MKILFCNESFPEAISRLKALLPDHELILCQEADIADHIEDVDVVVPLTATIDAALIERGRFGLIQQFGVGLDPVDIGAATRAGVRVARIPSAYSGNADSVAEHALLLMLSLARQMPAAQQAFSERQLGQPIGQALIHKRACVVGLGGVGLAVARRLNACGMRLVGVHEHPEREVPTEAGLSQVFTLSELHDALADADWVVLCLNYDASRHHLFDAGTLAAMKPGASIVNVARGGLLDAEALTDALARGHIQAAGLDVFEDEPTDPKHPLFLQNVLATPHIAGVTDASYDGTARMLADNINRYARGEAPEYVANEPEKPR